MKLNQMAGVAAGRDIQKATKESLKLQEQASPTQSAAIQEPKQRGVAMLAELSKQTAMLGDIRDALVRLVDSQPPRA